MEAFSSQFYCSGLTGSGDVITILRSSDHKNGCIKTSSLLSWLSSVRKNGCEDLFTTIHYFVSQKRENVFTEKGKCYHRKGCIPFLIPFSLPVIIDYAVIHLVFWWSRSPMIRFPRGSCKMAPFGSMMNWTKTWDLYVNITIWANKTHLITDYCIYGSIGWLVTKVVYTMVDISFLTR